MKYKYRNAVIATCITLAMVVFIFTGDVIWKHKKFFTESPISYFILVTSFTASVIITIITIRDKRYYESDVFQKEIEDIVKGENLKFDEATFKKKYNFLKEKNYERYYGDLSKRIHTWLAATLILILSIVCFYNRAYKEDLLYNYEQSQSYILGVKDIDTAFLSFNVLSPEIQVIKANTISNLTKSFFNYQFSIHIIFRIFITLIITLVISFFLRITGKLRRERDKYRRIHEAMSTIYFLSDKGDNEDIRALNSNTITQIIPYLFGESEQKNKQAVNYQNIIKAYIDQLTSIIKDLRKGNDKN